MPTSQFKVYSSSDVGSPILTGISASLLNLLDACLVNGYGSGATYKSASGWSKPLGTDPNQAIAAYTPASGSKMTVVVYDNQPTGSFSQGGAVLGTSAWWCGWETLNGLTGSVNSALGSGTGNFPLIGSAQMGGNGGSFPNNISASYNVKKSNSADTTPRIWLMFADAWTMHLFIASDNITYTHYHFGDIYSLKGSSDSYRCWLTGKYGMNLTNNSTTLDSSDVLPLPFTITNWPTVMARTWGGGGISIVVNKISDTGKATITAVGNTTGLTTNSGIMVGIIPGPNPVDNSLYLSPVWIGEAASSHIRGRVRGLWMLCHQTANFSDGQIFYGANEQVGKSFRILKPGPGGGLFVMETSNTVETN